MHVQLLPASAAAFAPRASSVNVVLGTKVEPWLTQTLKRVNRVKRPLNSVPQHQRCLAETLSSPTAIWTLASLILPRVAEAETRTELVDDLFGYQLVHVEAYIVHVDMILRNEVAFKLTSDTIDALVDHHLKIHCVDAKANTPEWSEKDQQCSRLHEDFVQAVNKFVYRTHVSSLEGLEEDGAGELLAGESEEVKASLMGLMKPLVAPPPRVVDVVRQPVLLPSSFLANLWSPQPTMQSSLPAVDAWQVLSTSGPGCVVSTTCAESIINAPVWATLGMSQVQMSPPMPAAYTPPHLAAGLYFSSPPPPPPPMTAAPMPAALPLPSMLASSQCGISVGMGGGFGWDRPHEYATIM